jgi:hypothetical protein
VRRPEYADDDIWSAAALLPLFLVTGANDISGSPMVAQTHLWETMWFQQGVILFRRNVYILGAGFSANGSRLE